MSTFYGQVKGSADTSAGRRGTQNSGIRASVQSWNGSVIVNMYYNDNDELSVDIETSDGSDFYGTTIFSGTLAELKQVLVKK